MKKYDFYSNKKKFCQTKEEVIEYLRYVEPSNIMYSWSTHDDKNFCLSKNIDLIMDAIINQTISIQELFLVLNTRFLVINCMKNKCVNNIKIDTKQVMCHNCVGNQYFGTIVFLNMCKNIDNIIKILEKSSNNTEISRCSIAIYSSLYLRSKILKNVILPKIEFSDYDFPSISHKNQFLKTLYDLKIAVDNVLQKIDDDWIFKMLKNNFNNYTISFVNKTLNNEFYLEKKVIEFLKEYNWFCCQEHQRIKEKVKSLNWNYSCIQNMFSCHLL